MDNLSEEEKKAIGRIKYNDIAKPLACGDLTICNIEDLEIILNLIKKQSKEIEHLKNLNEHQSKDLTKAVNYTFELNKEIEIKDKIDRYGYDPKQLHHILRMNDFIKEYASGKAYKECLISKDRNYLIQIKKRGFTRRTSSGTS